MRLFSKKLTFQLTPLLDLLLIVVFAQFMDVQETQHDQQSQLDQQRTTIAQTLQQERAQDRNALAAEQQELANQQKMLDQREAALKEERAELTRQHQRAAKTASALFDLPKELVERAFSPPQEKLSPEEIAKREQAFKTIADKRGSAIIRHLLTYEEIRKRCDIWQIHIQTNGLMTFSTDNQSFTFEATTPEQFEKNVFSRYKAIPQPKGLVIVLLSYGNIQAGVKQAATEGLPRVTDRMRSDSNGRTRFEYAILGYTPDAGTAGKAKTSE